MNIAILAAAAVAVSSATAPDWENPAVNSSGRLPARTYSMPLASESAAMGSALQPETPYVKSLNGTWKISWAGDPALRVKGFWEMILYVKSRNSFTYGAYHFIADSSVVLGNFIRAYRFAFISSDNRDVIALSHTLNVSNVKHELVHTNPAHDIHSLPANKHLSTVLSI